MELHSPAAAKRLWKFLRVAFLMMRKGLISKRKLLMDMNLMMKRGKIMGKSIVFFHHHHQRPSRGHGFGLQEHYEFSCTPSPGPVFFPAKRRSRSHGHYFPCLSSPVEGDRTPGPAAALVAASPLSVGRLSNFSSDDAAEAESDEVDDAAEEFIRRFYEQLRVQSRVALIEYQEMEYQEMLQRGH